MGLLGAAERRAQGGVGGPTGPLRQPNSVTTEAEECCVSATAPGATHRVCSEHSQGPEVGVLTLRGTKHRKRSPFPVLATAQATAQATAWATARATAQTVAQATVLATA